MALPSLELLDPLPSLVRSKYYSAKACNALTFSPTHLAIVFVHGIPFQLRFCPALSQKPSALPSSVRKAEDGSRPEAVKRFDPFENPSPDLLIAQVPKGNATHNLILNKYPVIAQHFILATGSYEEQNHFLELEDLSISYACLREWEKDDPNKRLFAFFNSGPESGASQSHRHIQFLAVEEMHGDDDGLWAPLIDLVDENGIKAENQQTHSLPFAYQSVPIPEVINPEELLRSYKTLYTRAQDAVRRSYPELERRADDSLHSHLGSNETTISYNLAVTTRRMIICPRRSETAMISDSPIPMKNPPSPVDTQDTSSACCRTTPASPESAITTANTSPKKVSEIGPIALNGTILAGTLMVKTEEEWNVLKGHHGPQLLEDVLEQVGLPVTEMEESVARKQ